MNNLKYILISIIIHYFKVTQITINVGNFRSYEAQINKVNFLDVVQLCKSDFSV